MPPNMTIALGVMPLAVAFLVFSFVAFYQHKQDIKNAKSDSWHKTQYRGSKTVAKVLLVVGLGLCMLVGISLYPSNGVAF